MNSPSSSSAFSSSAHSSSYSSPLLIKTSTSLQIFRSYIQRSPLTGQLDVSGVVSLECYHEWLITKLAQDCDNEARKYHRTLTNHVSGVDGRSPFDPEEEAAILVLFRKREPWPCLPAHLATMGRRYRTKGHHEKLQHQLQVYQPQPQPQPERTPQSMINTAARLLQRDVRAEDVAYVLGGLTLEETAYVQRLTNGVVHNYSSPSYSLDDWKMVNTIFRFMILARTRKCELVGTLTPEQQVARAQQLCRSFAGEAPVRGRVCAVFDLSAKSYAERAVAQNAECTRLMGDLLRNDEALGVHGSELYSTMLAVTSAFLRPNKPCPMPGQRHYCRDGRARVFDMTFCADPDTLLFTIWGNIREDWDLV